MLEAHGKRRRHGSKSRARRMSSLIRLIRKSPTMPGQRGLRAVAPKQIRRGGNSAQINGKAGAKPRFLWHFAEKDVLLSGGGTWRGIAERRMRVRTLVRTFTYTFGLVALLSVLAALAGATPASAQLGFDRPG